MPNKRLARARQSLPYRYQFGDAGIPDIGPGSAVMFWDPLERREVRVDFPIDGRIKSVVSLRAEAAAIGPREDRP